MRVMGIDPGLATVGFGIVDSAGTFDFRAIEFGAVLTPAGEKTEDRLLEIYANIDELVNTFKPDAVSIEKLFFNTKWFVQFYSVAFSALLNCRYRHRNLTQLFAITHKW